MLSAASDIKHWLYANAVPLYTKGLSLNEFWHVGSPKTGIKGQCTYSRRNKYAMCSISVGQ